MTEFCSGMTAVVANQALKSALTTMEKAKQCSVLWFDEINERRLFRELGFASINQYAEQELGFSSTRIGDYLQLCRSFKKLPQVKEKVESGELGYTAARVLARVANKDTEKGWLDFALNNTRRELESEVKRAKSEAVDIAVGQAPLLPVQSQRRPAAVVPMNVVLEMTPTQMARYEKLWERIRKQRDVPADKVEALLAVMEDVASESSPRGEHRHPVQIHIHECPECEKATVQTGKGEMEISKVELGRAQCDCQVSRPNKRNTASIPPSVRRTVLARARHKCQRAGCSHTQFLEIHHTVPRSMGGSNDPDNCTCLCSACHGLVHDHKVGMAEFVVKEAAAVYRWKSVNAFTPATHCSWPD
jgi:5-methylcytosine-specific restriction endonuclease McrA